MTLSPTQRAALAQFLIARFKVVLRAKGDAAEMAVVSKVFGLVKLFGLGVPTSAQFMTGFWTTLGPVIYHPGTGPVDLASVLHVLMHEIMHAVQFWRDPFGHAFRYVSKRGRAELEAEAERAAIEGWYLLTGQLPTTLADIDKTRHGYAFADEPGDHDDFADLSRDLLEQAVTSVRAGVISTDVGLEVQAWLRANGGAA